MTFDIILDLVNSAIPSEIVDIENIKGDLEYIGAIEDGKVTNLGDFIQAVPLSMYNGAFLYRWLMNGFPAYPGIIISSIIDSYSLPGYIEIPDIEKGEEEWKYFDRIRAMNAINESGQTLLQTYLNLWMSFQRFMGEEIIQVIQSGELSDISYTWIEDMSINTESWEDLVLKVSEVNYEVYHMTLDVNKKIGPFNSFNVSIEGNKILQEVYRRELLTKIKGNIYLDKEAKTNVIITSVPMSENEKGELPRYMIPLHTFDGWNHISIPFSIPFMYDDVLDIEEDERID